MVGQTSYCDAPAKYHLDYIPQALGQQTQTLLRMTMETKLTPKVSEINPFAIVVQTLTHAIS